MMVDSHVRGQFRNNSLNMLLNCVLLFWLLNLYLIWLCLLIYVQSTVLNDGNMSHLS